MFLHDLYHTVLGVANDKDDDPDSACGAGGVANTDTCTCWVQGIFCCAFPRSLRSRRKISSVSEEGVVKPVAERMVRFG